MCKCRLHNLENESEETAMERRKLTKEDIDKVRNIEGFPIGTDEDIIALSDACLPESLHRGLHQGVWHSL